MKIFYVLFVIYFTLSFQSSEAYYTQLCSKNNKNSKLCCGNIFSGGCKQKQSFDWLPTLSTTKKTSSYNLARFGNCFASKKCLARKSNDFENSAIFKYIEELENLFKNIFYFNIESVKILVPFLLSILYNIISNPATLIVVTFLYRVKINEKLEKFKTDFTRVHARIRKCDFCKILRKDIIILERDDTAASGNSGAHTD